MPVEKWRARRGAVPASWPGMAVLSGPDLTDMVRETLFDLAVSIHEGDTRAGSWADYIIAVGNLLAAERQGAISEDDDERLNGAVDDAWSALEPDLGTSLYLDLPDARLVAHLLDDVAGRIGIEAP